MEKLFLFSFITATCAFYRIPSNAPYKWLPHIVVPTTNEELAEALCSKYDKGFCVDDELKIILVTQIFDFIGTKGVSTEEGCYHLSSPPECLISGQKKLNRFNQCDGLKNVKLTYDLAGIKPLFVGSNKYIVSRGGGLKGTGLKIVNNNNVFINGLSITDINPELIFGGDAIILDNATNIWIHDNYFSRIGRQMIVTGFNPCQNITISFNEFDGNTPYAAYCDGYHYWLWLFQGSDDSITLYHNFVHHTSGRGAHVTGLKNAKVLLHMIGNTFVNVKHAGLVEAEDITARILIEGNTFLNVSYIVSENRGRIYYPFNTEDAKACKKYLGRECLSNLVLFSGGLDFTNDISILQEFKKYGLVNTHLLDMYDIYFKSGKTKSNDKKNIKRKI